MKKAIKLASIFALFVGFTACNEEDNNKINTPGDKAIIVSPEQGAVVTLNPANPTNPAVTLVWNHAKYAVGTEINYKIEIAKGGTNFDNPILAGQTTSRQLTWTVEQLNAACGNPGADLIPFSFNDLDIRIKAAIGNGNVLETISDKITISVKPFSTALPKLAVPGNHQGWNPPTAPVLAASAFGRTDFEGFVWLDGEFKFVAQSANGTFSWPPAGGPDFGDDGTFDNNLVETNEQNISRPAGYYRVRANTSATAYGNDFPALKYNVQPANWAVTGSGTPNGWPDNGVVDHNMTYNSTTKRWEITLALSANQIKFRANDSWDMNLGTDANNDDSMDYGGPNIEVPSAGNYKIELDLSDPRKYKYILTPQ